MDKTMFGVLILISFFSFASASSSSVDVVNFSVSPYNESENNSFEGFVSNLRVEDKSRDSISWVWENSEDEEFAYNLVFLDSYLVANGTEEGFEAEGLESNECYEIAIVGIGLDGREGLRVSDVGCTLKEKKKKSRNMNGRAQEVFSIGFVDEPKYEEIVLGGSFEEGDNEQENLLTLICWVLGLLIFILFSLIVVFSRR